MEAPRWIKNKCSGTTRTILMVHLGIDKMPVEILSCTDKNQRKKCDTGSTRCNRQRASQHYGGMNDNYCTGTVTQIIEIN